VKYQPIFKEKLGCNNSEEVFEYLIKNLKGTITKWDYFVNWTKAQVGLRKFEINLNLLNYLIGKDNIEDEARRLIKEHPSIIETIPILLACRDNKFSLLKDYKNGAFLYEAYSFKSNKSILDAEVNAAVEFLSSSGFLEQLKSKRITSLVDYVFGVEVGLDSNGRKNRGGTSMEEIVEFFVADICKRNGYKYIAQATAPKILKEWNKIITVEKSSRSIDFAINTPHKLYLIEANFYSGGGSKLKSTAGEYKSDFRRWSADGHQFIWVTDGAGWKTAQRPLHETFNETDYILNLDMLEKGILEQIITFSNQVNS